MFAIIMTNRSYFYTVKKFWSIVSNKYGLVTALFLLQIILFENVDLFTLYKQKQRESQLRREVVQYEDRVEEIRYKYESLQDPEMRERFAREEHHFKRDNEVIFLFSNK